MRKQERGMSKEGRKNRRGERKKKRKRGKEGNNFIEREAE
jgi:hypothetical protein